MIRRVLAAVTVVAAATAVALPAAPASAAAQNIAQRSNAFLGGTTASGSPINGVSGSLYVAISSVATTGTASDIYLSTGGTFIQLGILQGRAVMGTRTGSDCSGVASGGYSVNWATPHLFLGARGPGQPCETLRDLGEFGSTGNFRNFGLRRNPDGTYYATLDSVNKYTTSITFPEAMEPGAVAETNDTCSFVRTRATTSSNGPTLAWHDNARGWQYWTTQYNSLSVTYPSGWTVSRPSGTAASFLTAGTLPTPDC